MRARSAPGSRPAAPCAPAPFSEARATVSDALKAQPAGDDALALVLAEGSGDHRPQIHVLRAETPARHAGVVPPREEAAALENDRVASGKSQADVHARSIHGPCQPGGAVMHGLSCAAGIPCAAGVPSRDARARVLAHSGRGERVRRPARRNQPPPGHVGVRGGVLLGRPRSLLRPRPEVDLRERPIFGAPPNAVRSLAIQLLAPDSMALPAAHAVTARDTQRHRETAAVLPIYRPLAEKHPDEHEQSSSEDHDCEPCPGTTRRRQHEDDRSDSADGYGEGRELTEVAT